MRRLLILITVTLLGTAPLGGLSAVAGAPDWNTAWDNVGVPELDSSRDTDRNGFIGSAIGDQLTSFRVPFFAEKAYIPEIANAEYMVVYVDTGEFVLDVKGPGSYIIDPAVNSDVPVEDGVEENLLAAPDGYKDLEVMVGKVSADGKDIVHESDGRYILDERGNRCSTQCTVLPGTAVLLMPGDWVLAPAGAICIWCLLHAGASDDGALGALFAFPLIRNKAALPETDFSWIQNHPEAPSSSIISTDQLESGMMDGSPVRMAWAIGPGSNCH